MLKLFFIFGIVGFGFVESQYNTGNLDFPSFATLVL